MRGLDEAIQQRPIEVQDVEGQTVRHGLPDTACVRPGIRRREHGFDGQAWMKPPSRIDQALRVLSGHWDLEEQQSIALLDDAGIPATRKKVDARCKCYGLAAVKGRDKPFR